MKVNISEAIKALEPTASFGVIDENIDQIDWYSEDVTQPSKEAIQTKLDELQAIEDNNQYKKDRQSAYASIQEQLDMQYWDAVNGTTTWKDHIAQVKSDNPKPSE